MRKKLNFLAIIPARGGSKGIPRKNIKLFNGKPLIFYTIKLAKEAKELGIIDDHIVSTDDREIASIAKKFGGNVPFLRPKNLATDQSPVIDTIIHAVKWWETKQKVKIHNILILQPTNPLTNIKNLKEAVDLYLFNQPESKCLISICEVQHLRLPVLYYKHGKYTHQIFKEKNPIIRRQDLKKIYMRNGAIYITQRDLLLKERKIINESPLYYEMSRFLSVAIDDMFDWIVAEFLMKFNKEKMIENL